MFKELKDKVIKVVKNSGNREINNDSNNKSIGIYMIYIDNFNDDKIIPIYIGQTGSGENRNFQNRYKEHLQEVMALNRLKCDYYREVLLSGFYDGHYKACKIFQYMVDHNCTLKDFHMIILEELDKDNDNIQELLDQKEQEYFSQYLPAFFGFNQINTVAEGNKEIFNGLNENEKYAKSDKLLIYELEDCENFIKYFGYGYTKFNYYHCYISHSMDGYGKRVPYELKSKKKLLENKYYNKNKFENYDDELVKIEQRNEKVVKDLENCKYQFEQIYAPKIKEYCVKNKIGIVQKYKDIVDILIYQKESSISDFETYLKRKKININILDILNVDNDFINLRDKYIELVRESWKLKDRMYEYRNIRRTDDLMRILPKKEYVTFPLKDKYQEIKFDNLDDNEVVINFEFAHNGSSRNSWDFFPLNLIKMDYKLNINNKIIEQKDIFLKPQDAEENDEIDYFEKDIGDMYKFRKIPFCVRNFPNYISTTMEIQNGINEFTLMNKTKFDFGEILDDINLFINEQTKVKIEVRNRMKNKCKEFIEDSYKSDNLLKKKILEYMRKKR